MLKAYLEDSPDSAFEVNRTNGQGIEIDGKSLPFELSWINESELLVRNGSKHYVVEILDQDMESKSFSFKIEGKILNVSFKDRLDLALEKMGMGAGSNGSEKNIKAPMPGLILEVACTPGQEIEKDEKLLVLEAMKMENVIKAPTKGTIKEVNVKKGDSVEKNQSMIQID